MIPDLRPANIGAAVAVILMVLGWLLVGRDPTDTESQIIFWSSAAIGLVVLLRIEPRDSRRERPDGHQPR